MSNTVFSNPALFGFSDMEPCLTFDVTGEARCAKPSSKFFWDGIHPTRAGIAKCLADIVPGGAIA